MKRRPGLFPFVTLSSLVLGLAGPALAADADSCTAINSVPTTITSPGAYCLNKDIATTMTFGSAITIDANDVTLDLHGYRLGDEGAGLGTTANGIFAMDHNNITVRNGTVKGFAIGISLAKTASGVSHGHLIEKLRLDSNTVIGIAVIGSGIVIRGNQVSRTGGTTALGANVSAYGIGIEGPDNRVVDNDVTDTVAQGTFSSAAINVDGSGAVVENNRVGNAVLPPTGESIGVSFDCCFADGLVVNNRITRMNLGIYYGPSTGKYRDNVTSGVATPYTGGTNAGNNN